MRGPKKRTFFVDTNVFLRTIIKENNQAFNECLSFFQLINNGKIRGVTSTLVIMEINFVLLSFYKFPKAKVQQILESILNLPYLKIIDCFNIQEAMESYKKTKIKLVDCLLASILRKKNLEIISYDLDFEKLNINRLAPKDIV